MRFVKHHQFSLTLLLVAALATNCLTLHTADAALVQHDLAGRAQTTSEFDATAPQQEVARVSAADSACDVAQCLVHRGVQIKSPGRRSKAWDGLSGALGWLGKIARNQSRLILLLSCMLLWGIVLTPRSLLAQRGRLHTETLAAHNVAIEDNSASELQPPAASSLVPETLQFTPSKEGTELDPSGVIGKMLLLLRGGGIELAPIEEYPRIPALDCDNPDSLFYTWRANFVGQEISEEWDFYNLVSTDRRDFTDATFSAGAGVVIFETGYTYDKFHAADTRIGFQNVPEMTIRSGLTNELELRFKWLGFAMLEQTDVPSGDRLKDYGALDIAQLGLKYEVTQQDGWKPMVTVIGSIGPPSGAPNFSGHNTATGINSVLGWGLRRWLYLKVSQGVDVYGKPGFEHDPLAGPAAFRVKVDNVSEWHQSVSLLSQFSKHIGLFHEWYCLYRGDAIDNRPDHFIDAGVFIYLTPNVQLDLRAGTRLSDRISEQFYGAGFSLRY